MFYGDNRLSSDFGNYWVKVNLDSDLAGFHWVAVTGIDMAPDSGAPPFLRIENSWGKGWGWNGTARLSVESFRRLNQLDNWTFSEESF
jgi:aminopeptidase C